MPGSQRIDSLDVLRGFAILGILVMNIQAYAMIPAAYVNPHAYGPLSGVDWWAWLLAHVFFDSKFLAIFAALFGAGVAMMAERAEAEGASAWHRHARRMLILGVIGLAHAYLVWYGDILFMYAVVGLLAFAFRHTPTRRLLVMAGFFYAVPVFWSVAMALMLQVIPETEYRELVTTWWQPSADIIAGHTDAYRGGWLAQMDQRVADALNMHLVAFPSIEAWRILAWMLAGIAAYRTGLLTGAWPVARYQRIAVLGFAIGVPLVLAGVAFNTATGWDMRTSMYLGSLFNHVAAPLIALAWTCLVITLLRRGSAQSLVGRLRPVGRGALSCYLLSSVLCTIIFYGHGLGLFGHLDRAQQLGVVVAIWLVLLVVAPAWFRHFHAGPVEWLWRLGVYRRSSP